MRNGGLTTKSAEVLASESVWTISDKMSFGTFRSPQKLAFVTQGRLLTCVRRLRLSQVWKKRFHLSCTPISLTCGGSPVRNVGSSLVREGERYWTLRKMNPNALRRIYFGHYVLYRFELDASCGRLVGPVQVNSRSGSTSIEEYYGGSRMSYRRSKSSYSANSRSSICSYTGSLPLKSKMSSVCSSARPNTKGLAVLLSACHDID